MKRVLLTGGAGFIGNAIIDELYGEYEIVVLDNFSRQIHGDEYKESFLFQSIKDKCLIIKGDICCSEDVSKSLVGVDYIIHLAAETGTGQSMYEMNRYTSVNVLGTSNLFETILKNRFDIKKIILSSSRSVYGEGMYKCDKHGVITAKPRNINDMKRGNFEVGCPVCGNNVELLRTSEESDLCPISYYAYTKMAQEKMFELMCPASEIPYTIFRYQNVYGAGQSLDNPYTGIISIFSKLLLRKQRINIFEDGNESRDFVHVKDVATATCNALKNPNTDNQCINIGSGENISVLKVAKTLKDMYRSSSVIEISGDFRKGDIRHNVADIEKSKKLCDFKAKYSFEQGMKEFTDWVKNQKNGNKIILDEKFENSMEEMKTAGILIKG